MSLPSETVVRLRAGATTTDPYSGTTVPDWSVPPAELPLVALIADAGTGEPLTPDRAPVDADYTLYIDSPDPVDVTAADRMRVRGDVCTVEGKPFLWAGAGTVIHCKIRQG